MTRTRWIDAMSPAERDELIDAGRIGPSRFDGPDEGEELDPIDEWRAYRDAYGPDADKLATYNAEGR